MTLAERLEAFRASHPPRTLEVQCGGLRYVDGGNGARTALLLHGGGSVAEAAHPFILALEREMRVLAVDWPSSATSVDDVTDALLALLDHARIERVTVLGFSLGGMLAQALVRRAPERVERMVLYVSMGPSARYAKRFARYRRVLSLVPERLLLSASKRAVAKWASAAHASDADAAAFIAAQRRAAFDSGGVTKASLLSDASILVDFFGRSYTPRDVVCPVFIVEGDRDRMVDDVERAELRRLYPQARIITLAATDHFAGVLAPPDVIEPLRAFLME